MVKNFHVLWIQLCTSPPQFLICSYIYELRCEFLLWPEVQKQWWPNPIEQLLFLWYLFIHKGSIFIGLPTVQHSIHYYQFNSLMGVLKHPEHPLSMLLKIVVVITNTRSHPYIGYMKSLTIKKVDVGMSPRISYHHYYTCLVFLITAILFIFVLIIHMDNRRILVIL